LVGFAAIKYAAIVVIVLAILAFVALYLIPDRVRRLGVEVSRGVQHADGGE
jgi:hypothetical protein